MPADTLNEMILGFAVIIGILILYVLSLVIRFRKQTALRKKDLNQ
jgi:hypothetical protein